MRRTPRMSASGNVVLMVTAGSRGAARALAWAASAAPSAAASACGRGRARATSARRGAATRDSRGRRRRRRVGEGAYLGNGAPGRDGEQGQQGRREEHRGDVGARLRGKPTEGRGGGEAACKGAERAAGGGGGEARVERWPLSMGRRVCFGGASWRAERWYRYGRAYLGRLQRRVHRLHYACIALSALQKHRERGARTQARYRYMGVHCMHAAPVESQVISRTNN